MMEWKTGHDVRYCRLIVEDIKFVGGYEDEHYVGLVNKDYYTVNKFGPLRIQHKF